MNKTPKDIRFLLAVVNKLNRGGRLSIDEMREIHRIDVEYADGDGEDAD